MTVIFSVFAGRKRYMSILSKYIDELYRRKLIDEIHIWDFTRNEDDEIWLKERWSDNIIPVKDKSNYGEYYQYYTRDRYPEDDTILIKCDDDIVYIDLDNFEKFVRLRPKDTDSIWVTPFVVNNPMCTNLLNINFKDRDPFSPGNTELVHNLFLDGTIRNLPIQFFEATDRSKRLNINFITIMSRDFDILFKCDPVLISSRDEDVLNNISTILNRRIGIYTGMIVCHMAYTTQRDNGFDETEILKRYHDLCVEKCS